MGTLITAPQLVHFVQSQPALLPHQCPITQTQWPLIMLGFYELLWEGTTPHYIIMGLNDGKLAAYELQQLDVPHL